MKPTSSIAITKPKSIDYLPAFNGSSLSVKLYLPNILLVESNRIPKNFTRDRSIFIFDDLETMDICNTITNIRKA